MRNKTEVVEQHRALIARCLLQRLHLFAAVLNAEQLPGVVQVTTRVVVQAEQLPRLEGKIIARPLPQIGVIAQCVQPVAGKILPVLGIFEAPRKIKMLVVRSLVLQFSRLFTEGRGPVRVFKGVVFQLHHRRAHLRTAGEGGDTQFLRLRRHIRVIGQ
ncbi:Uncharacterised protein [Yersinia similis]|nr:Uncharacterised protein [Yersinia similis]